MATYNLAQGGDAHFNENYALYPQNAFIEGRPEFGDSETVLKPAHHWEGGVYAPVRHMNFNDACHQCALKEVAEKFADGDSILTHVIPGNALLTDFNYSIHTPVEGLSLEVVLASDGSTIGTIDASVAGSGWFEISPTYVPDTRNDGIEIILNGWPDTTVSGESDPCGIYGDCPGSVDLCMTVVAHYKHSRYEKYCEDVCWDNCDC